MKKLLTTLLALIMILSSASCSLLFPSENSNGDITFTELVVADNENCLIKVTEIDPDNFFGYTLKVQLENKTADKDYVFTVESATVNGVSCLPLFISEVAPGEKTEEQIVFLDEDTSEDVIGAYTDIELTLTACAKNSTNLSDITRETVRIFPYGEEKATKYVREANSTDNIIVDNEYVTVIVTGYSASSILGYSVKLFLVNKTDSEIIISTDDKALINGSEIKTLFAASVPGGKCTFSSISWTIDTLKGAGIEDVEEIKFALHGTSLGDLLDGDIINQEIKLNP